MTTTQRGSAGTLLGGRYRLLEPLPGAGRSWRARDEIDDRPLLARVIELPAGLPDAERQQARQRSLREAAVVARVRHPGVAPVVDAVVEDGAPWVISVLPVGRSLGEIVAEEGPVSPVAAALIGLQVLDALSAAGVPHGELTPYDVVIAENGRVQVTGFATTPLGAVGTRGFGAPEGGPGPAADLWALGVTLHVAVEGRMPGGARPRAGALGPALEALLARDPEDRSDPGVIRPLLVAAAGEPEGPPAPPPVQDVSDPEVAAALAAFDAAITSRPAQGTGTDAAPAASSGSGTPVRTPRGIAVEPAAPDPAPPAGLDAPDEPAAVSRAEAEAPDEPDLDTQTEATAPDEPTVASQTEADAPDEPHAASRTEPDAPDEPDLDAETEAEAPDEPTVASRTQAEAPDEPHVASRTEADGPAVADQGPPAGTDTAPDRITSAAAAPPDPAAEADAAPRQDPDDAPAPRIAAVAAPGPTAAPGPAAATAPAASRRPPEPRDPATTDRPPAGATPAATGPDDAAPAGRRRLVGAGVGAGIVVAVLAAVLIPVLLNRGDDRPTAARPPTAQPTAAATTAASPTGTTASPEAPIPPPAGYQLYRDPAGWSIALPVGWTVTRRGTAVTFAKDGRALRVVERTNPPPDTYVAAQNLQPVIEAATPGFDFVRLANVTYRTWPTTDLEFRAGTTTRTHSLIRSTVPDAHRVFDFTWTCPDRTWKEDRTIFDTALQTFDPGA